MRKIKAQIALESIKTTLEQWILYPLPWDLRQWPEESEML